MDAITKKAHLRVLKRILLTIIGIVLFVAALVWLGDKFLLVVLVGLFFLLCFVLYSHAVDSVKKEIERDIKRDM